MKNHECLKPARSNSFGEGVNLKSIEIAKLHLVDRGYEEKTTVLRLFKTRHCEGVRKHDCGNPEKNPTLQTGFPRSRWSLTMTGKEKAAFTLTGVIVVIVIIAALAIILIPNMLSLMPDDHNIKYKKAFYTIQEIVNDIAKNCQGLEYNSSTKEWETINDTQAENVLSYCYDSSGKALYLADEICKRLSTVSDCSSSTNANKEKDIKTTDGMIWYFPDKSLALNSSWGDGVQIYVNVGSDASIQSHIAAADEDNNKKVSGLKGIYRMSLTSDGKLYPGYKGETEEAEDYYLLDNPTKENTRNNF